MTDRPLPLDAPTPPHGDPIRRRIRRRSAARPATDGVRSRRGALVAGAVTLLLVTAWFVGTTTDSNDGPARQRATAESSADRGGDELASSADRAVAPTTLPAPAVAEAPEATFAPDDTGTTSGGGGGSTGRGTEGVIDVSVGPRIVRTGSIDVVVARGSFARAYARLTSMATGAGGFVAASETSSLDDAPRGTVTLRVPVARFDEVVAQVGKIGEVGAVSTGSQDVTGEYSDVSARIHALESERAQITLVLGRAETIPDILAVRDRLNVVQGELEQLQGRQKVLDDQTSLSTLTVSISEKGTVVAVTEPPAERTGLDKLWHDVLDRFADGGRAIALGLATLAPWLILALVLALPARAIWRRSSHRRPDPAPA